MSKKQQETTEDLRATGLMKAFKGRVVVNDVSIHVRRGEAVGLLGPNGAGKTTSFSIITGLIRADGGKVTLDGRDITSLPMYRRARLGIGYLPQESSIFRGLTVEGNIRAILELTEPDREAREERLEQLLDEFSIKHIRNSPAPALSGVNAGVLKSRVHLQANLILCCWMSPLPVLILLQWVKSVS